MFCASCIDEVGPFVTRDGFTYCISCAGGSAVTVNYVTPIAQRRKVNQRREQLRAAKLCINGPLVGTIGRKGVEHGPPVDAAGRCQRCVDVKNGVSPASTQPRHDARDELVA